MAGIIKISILANARNAIKGLRDTGNAATTMGKKAKSGIGGLAAGLGAVAAIGVAGRALKEGVTEATAFQDAAKQTSVALKSNARLHGITAASIQTNSAALENLTGAKIDENDLTLASNRLIRSGVTSQAALNRALKASADVALGSGKDIATVSVAVSKALANPAKAAGVLGKANIVLTDAQKKSIAAMAKSGNVAGAQSAILSALEGKYKGASEAAGTGFAADLGRAQDAMADAKRDIATALLPQLSKLAQAFAKSLPNAVAKIKPVLGAVVSLISSPAFPYIVGAILAWVGAVKILNVVMLINNVIMAANPVGAIIVGILLLVGVIVFLATKTKFFQTIWKFAWSNLIQPVIRFFKMVWGWIKIGFNFAVAMFKAGVADVSAVWRGIVFVWNFLVSVFVGVRNAVVTALRWVSARVVVFITGVRRIWAGIMSLVTKAIEFRNKIINIFIGWYNWMMALPGKIVSGLVNGFTSAWHRVTDFLHGAIEAIPGWIRGALGISSPSTVMATIGGHITGGLVAGIKAKVPVLKRTMGIVSGIVEGGVTATASVTGGVPIAVGGTGTGGDTYNVNVSVATGADPAEVGRRVVDAIDAFQRLTGKRRLRPA